MRACVIQKINRYFSRLDKSGRKKIADSLSLQKERLNIRYFNDSGKARQIRLALSPWLVSPEELKFFHRLIYSFKAANQKLFGLYLKDERIRRIMPLREEEWEWFKLINRGGLQGHQVVFGRWDMNVTFGSRKGISGIKFLETNTVGIGGIHYIPAVSQALRGILMSGPAEGLWPYRLRYQPDPRRLLAQEIKYHARVIGRKGLNVAFMENREFLGGTVELPELSRYFQGLGIKAILADPRDLRLKGSEIYCRGSNIDIIYRDCELQELIDLERKGHNMRVLKQAFLNNQVISSIAGELDHKSGFEIFTSLVFSGYFSPQEKALFKRHIPWTRLLKERKTSCPDNRTIDLVPFCLKNKDALIIKPNRAYGGKGVVIGSLIGKGKWSEYVEKAVKACQDDYVVQAKVNIRKELFPVFNAREEIEFERFYSVSGFVVTRGSTAVLGRFSGDTVVNVAKGGGIIPVLVLA